MPNARHEVSRASHLNKAFDALNVRRADACICVCWRMLAYADVCWRMLTYDAQMHAYQQTFWYTNARFVEMHASARHTSAYASIRHHHKPHDALMPSHTSWLKALAHVMAIYNVLIIAIYNVVIAIYNVMDRSNLIRQHNVIDAHVCSRMLTYAHVWALGLMHQ
jgi:hypothetical protein